MKKHYWIETYGCQMNKAESAALEIELEKNGWQRAAEPSSAELVILNTCAVRKTAEDRIWGRIGEYTALKKKHPHTLAVIGCMAQRLQEQLLSETPAVDLVVGSFEKQHFLAWLQNGHDDFSHMFTSEDEFHFLERYARKGDAQSFIPIMHGCNNFCSYCIVPYVRGREISREPDDIVREIHLAAQHGCKEITLLGQNVNSYRYHISDDMTLDFPGLLERVVEQTGDIEWIRFLTSHPKDFSKQLITLIKEEQKLCKNIHLPVQSGSTSVLRAMNRRYDRDHYLELIDTIKREIPGVTLSTDVLVGFPGETEADFEETLDLMEKVRFSDAFTYKYNPRAGTKAYSVDASPVPEETKSARLETLIELQRSISHQEKQTRLGSTVQVLVEDISKKSDNEVLARTEHNDMVVFAGNSDMIGKFFWANLCSLSGNTFKGEIVK